MFSTILGKVSGLSFFSAPPVVRVLSSATTELSTLGVDVATVSTGIASVVSAAEANPLITQQVTSTVTSVVQDMLKRGCSSGCMCATTGVEPTAAPVAAPVAAPATAPVAPAAPVAPVAPTATAPGGSEGSVPELTPAALETLAAEVVLPAKKD